MTKKLIAPLVAAYALSTGSARAELLFGEGFDYPNGGITNVSAGLWVNHSGATALEIVNGRAFVDASKAEDVNRALPNADQRNVFAAFRLNLAALPTGTTYFSHLKDTGNGFKGRLFAVTNGALPGYFRIGTAGGAGTPSAILPHDLAPGTDYWVVLNWNLETLTSKAWVNPSSESDAAATSADTTSESPIVSFAFRQATGEGRMYVDDLQVATTFAEAVTNAPVATQILVPPAGFTANVGDAKQLFAVATGAGALNFEWKKGSEVVATGTNALAFPSIQESDAGTYTVTVTGANGTVTSSAITVTVNVGITPPSITAQPSDANVSLGTTVNLTVAATGSNPLSYQWFFNSNAISGEVFETLPLGSVQTSQAGFYHAVVANEGGMATSRVARVTVRGPVATDIAQLRSLMDANYITTDTTNIYTVEGVVTTHKTLTGSPNVLYYMQDDKAGIAVIHFGSSALPAAGDKVRVTGPLSSFNSLLELAPTTANAYHGVEILSSGNALPTAKTLAFGVTNDLAAVEALEGSLVKAINVTLPRPTENFVGNTTYMMTNSAGEVFALYINTQATEIIGQPIPAGPVTITGVLGQFTSNTGSDRKAGYQLIPTRLVDIEAGTAEHPPFTLSVAKGEAGAVVITWPAQTTATYSVVGAGTVTGPFTNVATGLSFPSGSGTYTVPGTGDLGVYRIVTP